MAYSKVERRTWNDERFRAWPKRRRDMWQYLLTTPHLDQIGGRLGCFVLDPLYAMADLSAPDDRWTPEEVEEQLDALEKEGRIMRDPGARMVLLCNFFRHNRPENPNVVKAAIKDVDAIPFSLTLSKGLLEAVEKHLPKTFDKGQPLSPPLIEAIRSRIAREAATAAPKSRPRAEKKGSERVPETVPEGLGQPFPIHEHEHEQEQVTTTEDKSSEAVPRDLNALDGTGGDADDPAPPPPNSNDDTPGESPPDADDVPPGFDEAEARAVLAPLIRDHLWLDTRPPRQVLASNPKWNMGRDLSIALGFLRRGEVTLEEMAGAIQHARRALHFGAKDPLSMLIFNTKDRRDRLNDSIALWRREETRKRVGAPTPIGDHVDAALAIARGGGRAK